MPKRPNQVGSRYQKRSGVREKTDGNVTRKYDGDSPLIKHHWTYDHKPIAGIGDSLKVLDEMLKSVSPVSSPSSANKDG